LVGEKLGLAIRRRQIFCEYSVWDAKKSDNILVVYHGKIRAPDSSWKKGCETGVFGFRKKRYPEGKGEGIA